MALDGADVVEMAGGDDVLFTAISDQPSVDGAIFSAQKQRFGNYRHPIMVDVANLMQRLGELEGCGWSIFTTNRSVPFAPPLLILGKLATLAVVAPLIDEAPACGVVFPQSTLFQNTHEDVPALATSKFSVTVATDSAGFAKSLYRQGARLVLPAGRRAASSCPSAED